MWLYNNYPPLRRCHNTGHEFISNVFQIEFLTGIGQFDYHIRPLRDDTSPVLGHRLNVGGTRRFRPEWSLRGDLECRCAVVAAAAATSIASTGLRAFVVNLLTPQSLRYLIWFDLIWFDLVQFHIGLFPFICYLSKRLIKSYILPARFRSIPTSNCS